MVGTLRTGCKLPLLHRTWEGEAGLAAPLVAVIEASLCRRLALACCVCCDCAGRVSENWQSQDRPGSRGVQPRRRRQSKSQSKEGVLRKFPRVSTV